MNNFTTLYLVRHGETLDNKTNRIQGQLDTLLNEDGMAQARQVAGRLKNMHFDHIYSSDLERAKYTAQCIAGEQEIIYTPQLREMNLGDWQGKLLDEIKLLYPEDYSVYSQGGMGFHIPGGESSHDLQLRAADFIQEIACRHPGETVLAVSHCGFIRAVFRAALGIADFSVRPRLDNTAISGFRTSDQGQNWQLLLWNDTAHLAAMTESTAE